MKQNHQIPSIFLILFLCTTGRMLSAEMRKEAAVRRPNVVLIVLDTLGARHLGAYTNGKEHSPNIDKLAESGAVFSKARSVSSWTKPAIASILTSQMPSYHGVTELGIKLSETHRTLAEELKDAGYATAGFISHTIMRRKSGYAQGFDHYEQTNHGGNPHKVVTSERISSAAIKWLDLHNLSSSKKKPFFLFLHYFDPHFRYMDHSEFKHTEGYAGDIKPGMSFERLMARRGSISAEDLKYVRDLFREEVSFTDKHIGRVLNHLRAMQHDKDTVVLLTADHGEEFMEHSSFGHTMTLFEEIAHIPFILSYPGVVEPGEYASPVSQIDVMPTILDLCEKKSEAEMQGVSLKSHVGPLKSALPDRALVAEVRYRQAGSGVVLPSLDAVWYQNQKLIIDKGRGKTYLFDVSADPAEKQNLVAEKPDAVASLHQRIANYRNEVSTVKDVEAQLPREEISDQEIENLKSLGYL